MQTDPIGIAGGANLYAYAGNDPVNATDPSGLSSAQITATPDEVLVTGTRAGRGGGGGRFASPFFGGNSARVNTPNQDPCNGGFSVNPNAAAGCANAGMTEEEPMPENGNLPCPTGSSLNIGGGGSVTGFLGILGLSAGLGGGVSAPAASLPLVGNGSFRGAQFSLSGSITPLAGFGLFAGIGPSYLLGGSNGAAGNVSGSVIPVIQMGAGDGAGVEVTGDLNSPLSLSGGMGRIAAGVYGAFGARFEGKLSTNRIGCN